MPNERHYSNELNLESVGINLPYNMQAEQSVLGAVLLKPETLTDLVEIIRPEMFYTRQNAQIYSEMLRLFTADQTIDFVTLLDAVISDGVFPSADEAKVYLTGLAETVPSISNVKAYAQIVQEKYLVRQLMGVAKDILQDAGDEPDADLLLENAEQRIYEIRSGRDSSALTPLSSSMVETLTNLQKISGPDADKYKGIPTGFRLLDTVLTGLGRGDLIILAARPGMGKTSFALNIATRVAMQQKVPVAIFSLEMTKEQLTNRILSAEAGIDSQAFRTGALRAEDWEYLALATEKLHDAPIYMDDTSGITITEMKAKIRRVNQDPTRPNVGLIVIDYLQLMTTGQRTENRVQEISSITRNLKIMAKEMNVPIIALSQLSRAVEKQGESYFEGSLDDFWRNIQGLDARFEEKRQQLEAEDKRFRFDAKMENGACEVGLQEVDAHHPFYELEGSNNIIMISTERYHEYPMIIKGYGAGADVTAAGVFADIISIANIR